MVIIQHKGAEIRMNDDGIRVVMSSGLLLPGTHPSITAARVAIAHDIYRKRSATLGNCQ